MNKKAKERGFATRQIHVGSIPLSEINPLVTPIFQSSTFIFDSAGQGASRFSGKDPGYIYSRLGNPNQDQVAEKIANLEGAEAGLVLSSGMAAISTSFFTLLQAGDHILVDETLYSNTFTLLKNILSRWGIEASFMDLCRVDEIQAMLRPNTKAVFFETPTNPKLKIVDIETVTRTIHAVRPEIQIIVDNTFCTPFIQRPLELGADIVIHSGTKYLNGHGDVVCGFICGRKDFIYQCKSIGLKLVTGAVISPFDSFLINRGLKTLDIRMERHSANAQTVAEFLENHSKVAKVFFPGLSSMEGYEIAKKQMHLPGGMITFELNATRSQTEAFINSLSLCSLAVSLGDVDTLIQHPASMTHALLSKQELSDAGISESMLRLSVGLETVEDIIEDLKEGLDRL